MFVCVCMAVTESEVREAVGCGAKTREAVTRACRAGGDCGAWGAGGECGACHGMTNAILEEVVGPLSSPTLAVCPPPAESAQSLIAEESLVRSVRTTRPPTRAA